MRKIASILIMMTFLVSLTGCSAKADVAEVDKMYIQEAELTDKEKAPLLKIVALIVMKIRQILILKEWVRVTPI